MEKIEPKIIHCTEGDITIREVHEKDAEEFRSLRKHSVQEQPDSFVCVDEYLQDFDRSKEEMCKYVREFEQNPKALILGAERLDGTFIGKCRTFVYKPEIDPHIAYLGGVYVQKEYRSTGIGQALVDSVYAFWAQHEEVNKIVGTVIERNKGMTRFWEKRGYKRNGFDKDGLPFRGITLSLGMYEKDI